MQEIVRQHQQEVSEGERFEFGKNWSNFLRLLWEVSVVNAPGFFLYYETTTGQDLPAALFAATAPKRFPGLTS